MPKTFERAQDMTKACEAWGFTVKLGGSGHYSIYNNNGYVASFSKNMKRRDTLNNIMRVRNVTGIDIREEPPPRESKLQSTPGIQEADYYGPADTARYRDLLKEAERTAVPVHLGAGSEEADRMERDSVAGLVREIVPRVIREIIADAFRGVMGGTVRHRVPLASAFLCGNCETIFPGPADDCPSCASESRVLLKPLLERARICPQKGCLRVDDHSHPPPTPKAPETPPKPISRPPTKDVPLGFTIDGRPRIRQAPVTEKVMDEVKALVASGEKQCDVAKTYGLGESVVSRIIRGRIKGAK